MTTIIYLHIVGHSSFCWRLLTILFHVGADDVAIHELLLPEFNIHWQPGGRGAAADGFRRGLDADFVPLAGIDKRLQRLSAAF